MKQRDWRSTDGDGAIPLST